MSDRTDSSISPAIPERPRAAKTKENSLIWATVTLVRNAVGSP
jgi:hypothetical protein